MELIALVNNQSDIAMFRNTDNRVYTLQVRTWNTTTNNNNCIKHMYSQHTDILHA